MKKILFSHPTFFPNEVAIVRELLAMGLDCFHVRKPQASFEEMEGFLAEFSVEELRFFHLHEHHNLVKKYPLGGIHNNSRFFTEPEKESGRIYSIACHSWEEIFSLSVTAYSYAFLSPIFDSISKKDYRGMDLSQKIMQKNNTKSPLPVMALGGIEPANSGYVKIMGFAGLGVLGYIWGDNPSQDLDIQARWASILSVE